MGISLVPFRFRDESPVGVGTDESPVGVGTDESLVGVGTNESLVGGGMGTEADIAREMRTQTTKFDLVTILFEHILIFPGPNC